MIISVRTVFRRLSVCLALVLSSPLAAGQGSGEEKPDSGILLRVLCKRPAEGASDLRILQEGKVLHELKLRPSLVTDPLKVTRGPLVLARERTVDGEVVHEPVLKMSIPGAGRRFVLALFPSAEPDPAQPYQHRLLRIDGKRFETSDLYLFNLTGVPVGGLLGTATFKLAPDKSVILTPKPADAGGRLYQARFYYQREEEPRLFNDTRWPLARSARIYLFFIPDPERNSIGYQSFREYAPYP